MARRDVRPLIFVVGTLVGASACSMETGAKLDGARIVHMDASPSAISPPAQVTASVKIFDPEFRRPTIQWYLVINPPRADFPAINQDLSDPDSIDDPENELFYLGSGTTVTGALPEIDPGEFPAGDIFDTVPLYVLASVKVGDEEFKGFKQVRIVLPELVRRVLRRNIEDETGEAREPTNDEVADAIRVRLNQNPVIKRVKLAVVPDDGEYSIGMTEDLLERRQAVTRPVRHATGFTTRQGLRIEPVFFDGDLATNPAPAEPGYNKPEIDLLATEGTFYPMSLTSADWVPFDVKGGGLSAPKIDPQQYPLVTVQATIYDRQGGTANIGMEIDAAQPPREPHRNGIGNVLLAEGQRMIWLSVTEPAHLALEPDTRHQFSVALTYTAVLPHGVTGRIESAMPLTTGANVTATTVLDDLDRDPFLRHSLPQTLTPMVGYPVRTWQP